MRKKKGVTITTTITRAQEEAIEALVYEDLWASRAEFIRSAINNELERKYEERKAVKKKS